MIPFEKCPVCGGEVVRKPTEKLLRGGVNLATMTVASASVPCPHTARLRSRRTCRRGRADGFAHVFRAYPSVPSPVYDDMAVA